MSYTIHLEPVSPCTNEDVVCLPYPRKYTAKAHLFLSDRTGPPPPAFKQILYAKAEEKIGNRYVDIVTRLDDDWKFHLDVNIDAEVASISIAYAPFVRESETENHYVLDLSIYDYPTKCWMLGFEIILDLVNDARVRVSTPFVTKSR